MVDLNPTLPQIPPVTPPVGSIIEPEVEDKKTSALKIAVVIMFVLVVSVIGFLLLTTPGRRLMGLESATASSSSSTSSQTSSQSTSSMSVDQTLETTLNEINSSSAASIDSFDADLDFNAQ